MDSEEYNSNNSMLPVFEAVARNYGGEFKNFKFSFKSNPEGLEQLKNALGNPEWFNDLVDTDLSEEKIVRNAIKCKHCGDVIESRHTHDFKTCKCGRCFVDGGLEYIRHGGNKEDYEDLSIIEEE